MKRTYPHYSLNGWTGQHHAKPSWLTDTMAAIGSGTVFVICAVGVPIVLGATIAYAAEALTIYWR